MCQLCSTPCFYDVGDVQTTCCGFQTMCHQCSGEVLHVHAMCQLCSNDAHAMFIQYVGNFQTIFRSLDRETVSIIVTWKPAGKCAWSLAWISAPGLGLDIKTNLDINTWTWSWYQHLELSLDISAWKVRVELSIIIAWLRGVYKELGKALAPGECACWS